MSNNQTNYDAGFCSTIPLHNTNAIQPHAILWVVDAIELRVIQISSNVCEWLGLGVDNILNQPLVQFVERTCVDSIKDKYRKSLLKNVVPEYLTFLLNGNQKTYLARIHELEHHILIEIEFINEISEEKHFVNGYQKFQQIAASINRTSGIQNLAMIACQEIKRISGFDKVMIYAFDEKWNGLVIGEAMEEGMESYIGLKFPASDVPKQARDLYLKNPYRIIPDRNYERVSLIPELNPVTKTYTNLTDIKSRSVVSVHLEYLANMKVQASMSTRIIHNESLWGLIACHHREPKFLSFEECAVFEMVSNVISSKISSLVNQVRADERMRLNALLTEINSKILLFDSVLNVFRKYENEITKLLGGDGIAVCWEGEILTGGIAPQVDQLKTLLAWLNTKDFKVLIDITSLPDAFEPAKEYAAVASGILVLPIQPYDGNFILAFKREALKTVSWGGNPDNVLTFEKDSTQYHPRNSFATWKETVRNTSDPWSEEELIAAERFRNVVVENTLKKLTSTLEQKVKERTRELGISNENLTHALEELQELTHVTSHDLQEPVRKILLFSAELDKPLESDKKKEYISKIRRASTRISSLITDLVNISKIRGNKVFQKCDLQIIVEEVLKKFPEASSQTEIHVGALPEIDGVPEQIEKLFTMMIDNAIKFRRPTGESHIEINADFVSTPGIDALPDKSGKFVRISILDNGIGFNEKHANKLFKVFETLHPGAYEGTGSSLAIAKRIVESHSGRIFAQGKEGKGAVFTVILPVFQ
ncbi:MAG TPA: ATP-binding protein [Ohtaekwangia sp.]|nr:ATP-binding protein [Ohtaekwangia sp.]